MALNIVTGALDCLAVRWILPLPVYQGDVVLVHGFPNFRYFSNAFGVVNILNIGILSIICNLGRQAAVQRRDTAQSNKLHLPQFRVLEGIC